MNPHHEFDHPFVVPPIETVRERIGWAFAILIVILCMIGISAAILYAVAQAVLITWHWLFG